jgi:aryl carrier-like protein
LQGAVVAVEEEKEGDLHEWLMEVVEEMAGSINMQQTFESAGLDSLALISLARRLSAKVGRTVSVVDLYDNPTPQKLLDSFSGGPQLQLARPKVVCLHGFRSNMDALALSLSPFVSAAGIFEWIFINAPRRASGPKDPQLGPDLEAFEWWGQRDGSFETGWMKPHFDGLEDTLPTVTALAPVGVVGFSQGAAVASLIGSAWLALFSAVVPPGMKERQTPSFHCYDPEEEFGSQCMEVANAFSEKEVHTHSRRHAIPQDAEIVRHFVDFAARQPTAAPGEADDKPAPVVEDAATTQQS